MNLCLVRHAKAEERGPAWPDDSLRPLSPAERKRMGQAAAGLSRLFTPAVILSSPLVRAAQTAEILRHQFGLDGLRFIDALADADHDAILREANAAGRDDVLLVGHEPDMSQLLSLLVAGDQHALRSRFGTGAAAIIACDGAAAPGSGTLEVLLQTRALRDLGGFVR
jgi:phosphohistidine phosphatase